MENTTKTKTFLNENGAAMLEYSLMAALIAVAALVAVTDVGANISDTFTTIGDALTSALERIQS